MQHPSTACTGNSPVKRRMNVNTGLKDRMVCACQCKLQLFFSKTADSYRKLELTEREKTGSKVTNSCITP